ncbi:hypothetical protein NIES2101_37370 [Calothrix sp. HK-06]|nr:hypothetical protein NIES2101_37370 [Calothrix sp. HK-06]
MSKLVSLNKRNGGCPVCGKDDGACRRSSTDYNFIFCKTYVDARKGERVGDYVCVKEATGHTASFKLCTENWTEEAKREFQTRQLQEQQLRKQKQELDDRERQGRALSIEERHQGYSEIHNQLSLDAATVTDLRCRGFCEEEIKNSGFKSVHKYQKLDKVFDTRLPGVSKDGKSLVVAADGYLCPVRDFDGNITAFQLRLHNPEDGNRYRWLSTPDRATLKLQPEDENPLAVFHPIGDCKGIAIIEGTGPKPYFVSQRLGFLTIGAAGGQWLGSPKLLEKYIKQAREKYGADLPIVHIPDAGFALNAQVRNNTHELLKWLKTNFNQTDICVLDWNQIHKSQGDIDEIDLSIIRTLNADSFLKKYKEVFQEQKDKDGQTFLSKRYQNWAEERITLTADIVQREKWLTIPPNIQEKCDILLVRKALGGGKTQALINFLKPIDIVTLLVGYRNSLLNNTIGRAREMGLNAQHVKEGAETLEGLKRNHADTKLWAGCADSYFKFDSIIQSNPDYYLIHDEICSVLGHLKGGGTLKGRQKQAIEWVVKTIQNSGFAIFMDANLCDKDVDFIRQLFPGKRIKVLDSLYDTNPRNFYFLETTNPDTDFSINPRYLPSRLVDKAKDANKVLWISDSQRSCEVANEILTNLGHKHYRLDSKTSHDELSKLLQLAPKKFILTEELDSLSISPSGESGLSIDLFDYFDAVCFDIRGTVGVNTLTQLSARLRDTKVPIYVACPEFVNITHDLCPYPIKQVEEVINKRIEKTLAQAIEVDKELIDSQFVTDMFKDMGKQFSNDPWFIESLKDSKQLKYEHQNLKLMLKTALAQAGNRIIDLVEDSDESVYQECQDAKKVVKRREADKVFNSDDISWKEAQDLSAKDVNYDDKCKIRKATIKHKLPGIEETPSWSADFIYLFDVENSKFIDSRWRLKQLQNKELLHAVFKTSKQYNFEYGFVAQDIWKNPSTKIDALKRLGVDKIIDADVFSGQDDWIREIIDEYYDNPEWFQLIGISKPKRTLNTDGTPKNLKYVKDLINKFLEYFGLETKLMHKTKDKRYYKATTPEEFDDFLLEISNCLNRRAESTIASAAEISLTQAANKGEQALRQQQEWEQRHQAELNKRILEKQLKETQLEKDTENTDEWEKQEAIEYVKLLLEDCENAEALAELRASNIPARTFKRASKSLSRERYEQIRQWVINPLDPIQGF